MEEQMNEDLPIYQSTYCDYEGFGKDDEPALFKR